MIARTKEEMVTRAMAESVAGVLNISPSNVSVRVDSMHCYMDFLNVPLFSGKTDSKGLVQADTPSMGNFSVRFPRGFLTATKNRQGRYELRTQPKPLQQADVSFLQRKRGDSEYSAYVHPHIFSSGFPCWRGASRRSATDFLCVIVETFLYVNVSDVSKSHGHFASFAMGKGEDAIAAAHAHQAYILSLMHINRDLTKIRQRTAELWMHKAEFLCRILDNVDAVSPTKSVASTYTNANIRR